MDECVRVAWGVRGGRAIGSRATEHAREPNEGQDVPYLKETQMTRLRRLVLAVVVGVLATLPTAGSALAGFTVTGID
jgi:hypothetical protein